MTKNVTPVFVMFLSAVLVMWPLCTFIGYTEASFGTVAAKSVLQTILIRPDGSVYPDTAQIQISGNTYTFTDDINARIVVDRSDVVIDGAGYTLRGPYNGTKEDLWIIGNGPDQGSGNATVVSWTVGIDMAQPSISRLVVRNLNIKNFSIGMYLWTPNNTVVGNSITETIIGILLSGAQNNIIRNYVAKNDYGLFFGQNGPGTVPENVTLSLNSFISNGKQLSGCVCKDYNFTEAVHNWDSGEEGNFWSDYKGTDNNKDGIGDTPYVIDALNQDRYPLMQSAATSPTAAPRIPVEEITIIVAFAVIAIALTFLVRTRKHRVLKKRDSSVDKIKPE